MAEITREDRQEVAAMNVEEQKEAVEGADNAIARRLRELQFRAAAPVPVTPAELENTPTALAIKACRERDEAAAARDARRRGRAGAERPTTTRPPLTTAPRRSGAPAQASACSPWKGTAIP